MNSDDGNAAGQLEHVEIQIPALLSDPPRGVVQRHVGMRLSLAQGRALKTMAASLDSDGARLENGRAVIDGVGAVRFLLERYAARIDGLAFTEGEFHG